MCIAAKEIKTNLNLNWLSDSIKDSTEDIQRSNYLVSARHGASFMMTFSKDQDTGRCVALQPAH